MLKENKIIEKEEQLTKNQKRRLGWFEYDSWLGNLGVVIYEDETKRKFEEEEYYFTEFETSAWESDYHRYAQDYYFEGVLLDFNLNELDTYKYFNENLSNELIDIKQLVKNIMTIIKSHQLINDKPNYEVIKVEKGFLQVVILDKKLDPSLLTIAGEILNHIRDYYSNLGIHITRMFGSYVLLKKVEGELKAIKATPVPIKYCPLMIKLLKEVGGEESEELIRAIQTEDKEIQSKRMCDLIDKIVIKGGYFDTNRPLNSCEANVLFGASETIASAFKSNLLDGAVIVSNNLGTIITTNESNTQGAVKRMTGLFYTSPSEEIVENAYQAKIIPVFPNTAAIDQIEGVKMAIRKGYKKIAVTLAAQDNALLEQIKELENEEITIYKFGLCSTGIDKKTALLMKENADIIWSCASKYVKEYIEPVAIAQVGVKIPVHIMTKKGWELVCNHLEMMYGKEVNATLEQGSEKPVLLNQENQLRLKRKKDLHSCTDCPHPCI